MSRQPLSARTSRARQTKFFFITPASPPSYQAAARTATPAGTSCDIPSRCRSQPSTNRIPGAQVLTQPDAAGGDAALVPQRLTAEATDRGPPGKRNRRISKSLARVIERRGATGSPLAWKGSRREVFLPEGDDSKWRGGRKVPPCRGHARGATRASDPLRWSCASTESVSSSVS